MPRVISFIVLLAIVLLVGTVFFQVMAQFLVPMFLACVLLVVFKPLHSAILDRISRWPRAAALLTTALILLMVLLPLVWLGWRAYVDFNTLLGQPAVQVFLEHDHQPPTPDALSVQTREEAPAVQDNALATDAPLSSEKEVELSGRLRDFVNGVLASIGITWWRMDDPAAKTLVTSATAFIGGFVITSVKSAFGILVGLVITVISLYYFLADGPAMIHSLMRLSPLDERYERELLERFVQVSRAVVVATLLSALAQGALAGIGYYFALPAEAPIFLLIALTMVTAMIPFFGAFLMWCLVCLWLFASGEPTTAIVLAVYCGVIVSGIDNVIKPLVLHGQSNLHPLLALLSILGGVTVLGPVGIIVGPMLVSFLQALLDMLRKELELFGRAERSPQLAGVSVGTIPNAGQNARAAERPGAEEPAPRSSGGIHGTVEEPIPAAAVPVKGQRTPRKRRG